MVSEELLKQLNSGEIFAEGKSLYLGQIVKWVAVRGKGYWDWAIYYSQNTNESRETIASYGEKVYSPHLLLSFDDSAKALYRN